VSSVIAIIVVMSVCRQRSSRERHSSPPSVNRQLDSVRV